MASRSRSRQLALQLLFQKNFSPDHPQAISHFWEENKVDDVTRSFCDALVAGVSENQETLDFEITAYLKNWSLDRIATTDKLILRLAFYELTIAKKVPWKVIIDEAIGLSKLFSAEKSHNFINGVLHAWSTQNGLAASPTQDQTGD